METIGERVEPDDVLIDAVRDALGEELSAEKLLTAADAARILGVVPARVRQLANEGQLPPAATTVSGTRLFRREDVERLAKVRETKRNQAERAKAARRAKDENHE